MLLSHLCCLRSTIAHAMSPAVCMCGWVPITWSVESTWVSPELQTLFPQQKYMVKGTVSHLAHAHIEAKLIENVGLTISISVGEFVALFKSAFILAILGKFRKFCTQQLSSVLIESICWGISVEFPFSWHCRWGKLGLRSLLCRPVVAVDLEAVGKGSTTAVPHELKSGKEAINECGWIVSFTRRGFRQSWNAATQATRHLQAIFYLWSSDEGKLMFTRTK